jgi:protein-S-isoprenylcysteine O-methyltransferase Ste14
MLTPDLVMPALWAVWWISWLAAAAWSDRAAARPPGQKQILYRMLAAAGALLLFGPYRHEFRSELVLWRTPVALSWTLIAIACIGLTFTWWARIHLGRLWSPSVGRKADHRVVDTGPYGIVRHPIYTGIILASLATAAMRGTVTGWAGAAVMTLGWWIKARLEEGFLREQLGAEAYGEYARRVPMLVPRFGSASGFGKWSGSNTRPARRR